MAHKLRDKFLDEKKLKELQDKAVEDRTIIRTAIDVLRTNGYPVETAEDVKNISVDGCKAKIQEGRKAYLQKTEGMFFPKSITDEALAHFDEAEKSCVEAAPKVSDTLAEYPGVIYRLDSSGRLWWDDKTLTAFLQEKATIPFDETDKWVYELLGNVIDALQELYKYEKEADIVRFTMQEPWQNVPSIQEFFKDWSGTVIKRPIGFSINPAKYLRLKNWQFVAFKNQEFRDSQEKAAEDYKKWHKPVK